MSEFTGIEPVSLISADLEADVAVEFDRQMIGDISGFTGFTGFFGAASTRERTQSGD